MGALYLDHVSVTATTSELERLGFRVTPTLNAADHSRVLLDGVYLEVASSEDQAVMAARGWFIRPEDLHEAANRLRGAGVPVIGPSDFHGHDGTWRDVSIDVPEFGAALPMLTRRTDVTADMWPPPLHDPHPNVARRISEIRLRTADVEALTTILTALALQRNDDAFLLDNDVTVLVEASPEAAGVTSLLVEREGAAPFELTFTGRR